MKEYPTEEELEFFIKQMEQQELYAPRHMKEQILSKAFPKQTVEILPKSGSSERRFQVLSYRFKIIAGMAAAIFMLFLLPSLKMSSGYERAGSPEAWKRNTEAVQAGEQDKVDVNNVLNEGTRQINQKFNEWFGQMDSLQIENIFKM